MKSDERDSVVIIGGVKMKGRITVHGACMEIGEVPQLRCRTKPFVGKNKLNPLYIETKSRRLQLLMQPSLHAKLKDMAEDKKMSVNDLIHTALEEYIKTRDKAYQEVSEVQQAHKEDLDPREIRFAEITLDILRCLEHDEPIPKEWVDAYKLMKSRMLEEHNERLELARTLAIEYVNLVGENAKRETRLASIGVLQRP